MEREEIAIKQVKRNLNACDVSIKTVQVKWKN